MIEAELADGTILEFPDETDTNVIQSTVKKYLSGAAPSVQAAPAPEKLGYLDKVAGKLANLGEGAALGFFDEIVSGAQAFPQTIAKQGIRAIDPEGAKGVYGENAGFLNELKNTYEERLNEARGYQKQYAKENPVKATVLNVGGGILSGRGLAEKLGGTLVGKSVGAAMRKAPVATSAGIGGISGGFYGFGSGEEDGGERLRQAGISSLFSTGAGAAGGFIGSKIAKRLAAKNTPALPQTAVSSIDDAALQSERSVNLPVVDDNAERRALAKVEKAIKKDFPNNWQSVLELWKSGNEPLAKTYGSSVRRLAKGSAQYEQGQRQAERYFGKEITQVPEKIKSTLSQDISGIDNYYQTADDLLEAGRKRAEPLYKEAFKFNKVVKSNEIDSILETPAGRKALKEAAVIMQNDRSLMGLPDPELKAIARDLASIGKMDEVKGPIAKGLNMRTLDYVKKALDAQVRGAYSKPETRHLGGIINNIKNSLLNEMDKIDITGKVGQKALKPEGGAYARARAVSGDYLRVQDAMDKGRDFMSIDPEILRKTFKQLSDAEKNAFKTGVGKQLKDIIDKTYEGRNPYNRLIGSKQQTERLMSVLSPKEFKSFERELKAADRLFKMRNEVLGGSPTTSKAMAAAEIAAGGADALQTLATGNLRTFGTGQVVSVIKKAFDGMNDKTASAVSQLLYETNPSNKLLLIEKMMGSKNFTPVEKQAVKQALFKTESYLKSRIAGAVGASNLTSQGLDE